MIKALFFDFDGTISDARGIAVKSISRSLDDFGYKIDRSDVLRVMGSRFEILLKELGLNPGHLDEIKRRFYRYFNNGAIQKKIKPCVSLKPLWKLKKKYPLVVISNSESGFLKNSIKSLGIVGLFDEVYGSDNFRLKEDKLKKLFKKMKISPKEAIYVGDRYSDIESARAAGCYSVAISNRCSWSTKEALKAEKPDYIIRDFRGLSKVISKIDSRRE